MKFITGVALSLPFLLACSGGGGGTATTTPGAPGSIKIQTSVKTATSPLMAAKLAVGGQVAMDAISPNEIEFDMGIAPLEGGSFVAGYTDPSATVNPATAPADDTVQFWVSTTDPVTGQVIGMTDSTSMKGVSETFQASDPSILNNTMAPGTTAKLTEDEGGGKFLIKFSPTAKLCTTLTVVGQHHSNYSIELTQVNEIVVRLAAYNSSLVDANNNIVGIVDLTPHFIVNSSLYSQTQNNLTVKTEPFKNVGYFLFMPASRIGKHASFTVLTNSVANPVTNDYGPDPINHPVMADPSAWTVMNTMAWITDPGCSGIAGVIDTITGDSTRTTLAWKNLAAYFQAYFIKFYAMRSTMFFASNPSTGVLGTLGNSGSQSSGLMIISLDDSGNAMPLNGNSVLDLSFDPTGSTFSTANGILDLEGNPPIKFTASIVKQ